MAIESVDFHIEDYPIGTGGPEIEQRIVAAVINGYESARIFWRPRVNVGKDVFSKIKGIFFSDAALAEMDTEGKIPIEIAEGWPKYLAMLGLGASSKKSGKVVGEYPDGSASAEAMSVFLEAIKDEENVEAIKMGAFGDGIVAGYPQFIWIEKPTDHLSGSTLTADRLPWDCTIPDVNWRKEDFSDAKVVYKILYADKADLIAIYPKRKKQIEEAFRFSPQMETTADFGLTIDSRDLIYSAIQAATENTFKTGKVHVIERHSLIVKPMEVWTSPESEKWQVLSPDWDDARKQEWIQQNPTYSSLTVEAKMHWVTTITMTGQLLENRPHWFQEGRFNCECYVPMIVDEKPSGIMEYAVQNWMLSAIAKTEHVQAIRLNNGNPLVVQDGAIVNANQLESEASKPRGKVIVRRGVNVQTAITTLDSKRDHVAWQELYNEASMTNDRLTVDRNVEGGTQSSQEAAKVFGARVTQVKSKYSEAIDRFNRFSLRLDNLIVKTTQILTNSHVMKRWIDPASGEQKTAEVNVPEEYDALTGEASKISNRLDMGKYQVVMAEKDNSISGRAAELQEFAEIMQSIGGSTPPEHMGVVLSKVPNSICNMIGKDIIARQEQAAQNPQKPEPKISVTLPLDKLPFNQPLQQAAQQLVGLQISPPTQAAQQPGPEQGTQGQEPSAMPQVAAGPGESTPGPIIPQTGDSQ
jgi:hypothetical protein